MSVGEFRGIFSDLCVNLPIDAFLGRFSRQRSYCYCFDIAGEFKEDVTDKIFDGLKGIGGWIHGNPQDNLSS